MTDYNKLAESYDDHYRRPIDLAEDRALRGLIGDVTGQAVLDLGCGTGHLLDMLDGNPIEYVGIDLAEHMLTVARRKHPERVFVQWDACEALPVEQSWDVGVCLWALPSFSHPDNALRNLRRVLRPGARYVILAYAPAYPGREHSQDDPATYRTWTARQLHDDLLMAGYPHGRIHPFRIRPDEALPDHWQVADLAFYFTGEMMNPADGHDPYTWVATGRTFT